MNLVACGVVVLVEFLDLLTRVDRPVFWCDAEKLHLKEVELIAPRRCREYSYLCHLAPLRKPQELGLRTNCACCSVGLPAVLLDTLPRLILFLDRLVASRH